MAESEWVELTDALDKLEKQLAARAEQNGFELGKVEVELEVQLRSDGDSAPIFGVVTSNGADEPIGPVHRIKTSLHPARPGLPLKGARHRRT